MPHCTICNAECFGPARHLDPTTEDSHSHTPRPSNEFVPTEDSSSSFCFQCSRDFSTPAALRVHLTDARVHDRSTYFYPSAARRTEGPYVSLTDQEVALLEHGRPSTGSLSPRSLGSASSHEASRLDEELQDPGYSTRSYETGLDSEFSVDESVSTSSDDDDDNMLVETSSHDHYEYSTDTSANAGSPLHEYIHTLGARVPSSHYTYGTNPNFQPQLWSNQSIAQTSAQEGTSVVSNSHQKPEAIRGVTIGVGSGCPPGTNCSSFDHFETSTHHPSHLLRPRTNGIMCPICLEPAAEITSTLCGHIFCARCIKAALQMREACPVCNRAISQWSTHPIYPVYGSV